MLSTHNRADLVSASPATTALDLTLRLAMRLSASMDRALAERGLTITRAGVLFALFEHGPLMQRQLSETLRWTHAT